jgi:putative signal transducing protein
VVVLLSSNDPVLVSFAASVLKDAGIEHNVADSHMSVIDGSINAVQNRILVAEGQVDQARDLLAEAGVSLESA